MNLPINIAEKLILLQNGEKIPASKLKHSIIDTMLGNGILEQQVQGRSKKLIFLRSPERLNDFLSNHYGVNSLNNYISLQNRDDALRSDSVEISSDSKLRNVRTFKGFLINSYIPIHATLNDEPLLINTISGSFLFVYDYANFKIPTDITIVGIENPENFRHINKQRYLFEDLKPLFVSRYPQNQSKDLLRWLESIPNQYLHFGDFDLAGIGIYVNEYKKKLADRARFLVPENIELLVLKYGNRDRYNGQIENFNLDSINESSLQFLIEIIHKHKKGLDQEVYINAKNF